MNQFFFLLFVYCLFLQGISILAIESAVVIAIASVCLAVYICHTLILCQYNSSYDHADFTGGYDVDDDDDDDDDDDVDDNNNDADDDDGDNDDDPGHAPFPRIFFQGSCQDFAWKHACQILKFVSFVTIYELLEINAQKTRGHVSDVTLATPPFTLL